MATKKVATKKAAKPVKPAKSAGGKTSAKPAAKAVTAKKGAATSKKIAKPMPSKKAPAKKTAAKTPARPAPKTVAKPAAKVAPAPKKAAPQPVKKIAPAPVKVKAPVKSEPVKKPVVAAPTTQTAKTATKPLEQAPALKEPAKPSKVVVPKTSTDKKIKYEPDFTRSVLDGSKQDDNKPMARYSDAELAEFRDLINRKLDVAKKELAYLQGLITRKDESGDLDEGRYMTMEDGSMSMEREQLSQMASRQIQFIDHLEKAIMRIENKTYGICRVTGKLIDKARLRAVPHATLSIEAKQMMNK